MRSIDMICPPIDEGKNNSTEIEENTSAINKLIEKLEEKIVISQLEGTDNEETDNEETDNEESEEENDNE